MAGMYPVCSYRKFSTNDEEKFEKLLQEWSNTISGHMRGKAMIIFDENDLALRDKATVQKMEDKEVRQVVMKEITFTYICINGYMCIMYKIWENKTQSVIYNMPIKWDGTELWVGE